MRVVTRAPLRGRLKRRTQQENVKGTEKRYLKMTITTCAEPVALCFVVLCGFWRCHVLIGSTGVFYEAREKISIIQVNNEDNQ